jgi:hypothetical protein
MQQERGRNSNPSKYGNSFPMVLIYSNFSERKDKSFIYEHNCETVTVKEIVTSPDKVGMGSCSGFVTAVIKHNFAKGGIKFNC